MLLGLIINFSEMKVAHHSSVLSLISYSPAIVCLLVGQRACAVDASSTARPGGFQFDGKISRRVLENYLSRSICIEGMLNGRGPWPMTSA